MNKTIKLLIAAVAALAGLNACNQDNERALYDESAPAAYSFLQPVISVELTSAFNGAIKVHLTRTDATEAAAVPVKLTAATATAAATLFTLPAPAVSFEAGAYEADAIVQFTLEDLPPDGMQHQFSIEFENAATGISFGGNKKTDVKATRKLTFVSVGTGTFTSNDVYRKSYPVHIERAEEVPDVYKALDLYAAGYPILIQVFPAENRAVIAQQEIGLSLFDSYPKTWLRADYCTYANGVITVTPGSQTNFNMWVVEPSPSTTGAFVGKTEILELPAGAY
jgi:hypothetical protein